MIYYKNRPIFSKTHGQFGGNVKIKSKFSSYAAKSDMKKAAGADTSRFTEKS